VEGMSERPFFAMVNTTIVHRPYNPPRPYKKAELGSLDRPRWFLLEKIFDREEHINREDIRENRVYDLMTNEGLGKYLADPDYLSDAEIEVLQKLYAASIKYLDSQLERLLLWMENSGYKEDTIIILTSDHGEYFGEHDLLSHPHFLFNEGLHVPLVMSGPNIPEGQRRDDLVSLVDIFDTICDLISISPPEETTGEPMFGAETNDVVYAEHGVVLPYKNESERYQFIDEKEKRKRFGAGRKAAISEDTIYVLDSNENINAFDKESGEKRDSCDLNVEEYRNIIENKLGPGFSPIKKDVDLSKDTKENLRKLGYMD
jgi:arylsulfatase A-like enzyme